MRAWAVHPSGGIKIAKSAVSFASPIGSVQMTEIPSITMLRYRKPRFPARCVSCGELNPHDTLTFYADRFSFEFEFGLPRRRYSVEAPVCGPCRSQLAGRRWFWRTVQLTSAPFRPQF